MSIRAGLENIKKIYTSGSSLDILLDFERVIDSLDMYAFPNWILGELVEGPNVQKYWVSCKFMWPKTKMPDPAGAKRLLSYGARVTYQLANVDVPAAIKSPSDFRQGSKKGKLLNIPVWYVEITMPKVLLKEIRSGSKEIEGKEFDLEELDHAYETNVQGDRNKDQDQTDDGMGNDMTGGMGGGQPPAPGMGGF
jgi:hypothetical protein